MFQLAGYQKYDTNDYKFWYTTNVNNQYHYLTTYEYNPNVIVGSSDIGISKKESLSSSGKQAVQQPITTSESTKTSQGGMSTLILGGLVLAGAYLLLK